MTSKTERTTDVTDRPSRRTGLPPGQLFVPGFPRFGTHLHRPPPEIPEHPSIDVTGGITADLSITLADLERLPQVERVEDFHCVAGWSATGLRWGGVTLGTLYRTLIEPALTPGTRVTHLGFGGYDGYRSVALLEDALADDVLVATRLGGEPLTPAHGAPVRLVSPSQYGFVSTKHLGTIEVHTSKPRSDAPFSVLTREHPRARVWREERHAWFPAAMIRPVYHALIRPIARLSARGVANPDGAE